MRVRLEIKRQSSNDIVVSMLVFLYMWLGFLNSTSFLGLPNYVTPILHLSYTSWTVELLSLATEEY